MSENMERKVKCNEYRCGWHGIESEALTALNPFIENDIINGCPDCQSVDTIIYACDQPDCWDDASCGTPTENGYRNICEKHRPNAELTSPPYTKLKRSDKL